MAIASPQFSYVQEWNQQFLSCFPHRFDYIFAPFPQPGQKPVWHTESRHPLSDRILTQSSNLFGVRFGPETQYALLDIDRHSAYHPAQDPLALPKLLASLEPLGFVTPILCTSSYSQGLHVYFPFAKTQRSWKLASAMATLVEANGFKIQAGQLELFPNTKHYVAAGSPSLFNAHRLPLQEPGAYLLNSDLEPIWSDQSRFVDLWQRCQQRNDVNKIKIRTVLKQQKRTRHFVSEKADKYLNDLNAEIEPGWTGKGQTNRLLGRITMRCFVFHHVIAGGQPLNGQALIDEVISIAQSLPGYKTWCRHQHEITKRVTDWVRCIENSHYFPYGSQNGKYKAPTVSTPSKASNWNQQQAIATQTKIQTELERLEGLNQLPQGITARFKALTQAGISGSSLYRYKNLWHPEFQTKSPEEETKQPLTSERQPARPEGAANWHNPPSLLWVNDCNQVQGKDLEDSTVGENLAKGRNPLQGESLDINAEQDPTDTIANIKRFLAQAEQNRTNVSSKLPLQPSEEQAEREATRLNSYLEQLRGYLCSGDPVLLDEALDVLSSRPDYLGSAEMAEALESALCQLPAPKAEHSALAGLIRILQRLGALAWSPEKLAHALNQAWGKSRLRELTLEELEAWRQKLQPESG